ncbi:MAG: Ig-like domain-containing protein [Candidatus Cloacimonetes bacterium]|nr:Ig-like domain-containing protein [Candidatus Cloacimonadota bacterium]
MDTVKPEIIDVYPDEFSRIEKNSEIVFTFSKSMSRDIYLNNAINIYPPITEKKFSWSGNTLKIKILEDPDYSKNYYFSLKNSLKDTRDNALDKSYLFVFGNSENVGKVSGNITFNRFENTDKETIIMLFSADSTLVFSEKTNNENYSFPYLNFADYLIRAYVDSNNNSAYDLEKEPYFEQRFTLDVNCNIDIILSVEDFTAPSIKSVISLNSNQHEIVLSEECQKLDKIEINPVFAGRSLKVENYSLNPDETSLFVSTSSADTLKYSFKILGLTDLAGNTTDSLSFETFSVTLPDSLSPEVVKISPRDGSVVSSLAPEISVQFSEIINEKDIEVTLLNTETNQTVGINSFSKGSDRKKYYFSPETRLQNFSSYTFIVEDNTCDPRGNLLKSEVVQRFIVIIK